ncbi:MAG: hypothetical protein ACLFQ4_07220 [Halanaerobium sp.]
MSRKKLITYLLIILTLVMIVDIRYVRSDNNLFEGFVTESIEEIIWGQSNLFQNNYNQDTIKAEKDGSLKLDEEFLNENEQIRSFNLKNDFGSIQLSGSQEQEINIDYTLKVHGANKEKAEEFIQDLEIIYNLDGENLEVTLNTSQTETPELIKIVEIDYQITIPEKMLTKLTNKYGELKIQDLKSEVNAANRYGSTLIKNIEKAVAVDLNYGEAEIYNLASILDLDSAYAENDIRNIDGEFYLKSSYGFNKINNLESELQIDSRYGGAEINSAANIDLNSKYTGFNISNVKGKITANSEYGDFKLTNTEDLDLELWYADLEISGLKDYELYNYDLKVEHGNIETDFVELDNDQPGQLQYQGEKAEYEIKINSEYGDILIN